MNKPNPYLQSYAIMKMNRIKVTAFHTVVFDGTPLDIANQKRSLETFKKNCHRFTDNPMEEWYRVKETSKLLEERAEKTKLLIHQVPVLEYIPSTDSGIPSHRHRNLWDFYDAIGYRREKQSFYPLGSLVL